MKKGITYIHDILALDMQTSSFTIDGRKVSIPYNFHLQDGQVRYNMKSLDEFVEFMESFRLVRYADENNRLVVYVHDLPYFFMHVKRSFDWVEETVFAMSSEFNVIRAMTTDGVEFRCSKALSGLSMDKMIDSLGLERSIWEHIDHDKVKTPHTVLDPLEEEYIKTNTQAISELIKVSLKSDSMRNIPTTLTGYLRKDMRRTLMKSKDYKRSIAKMKMSVDDYFMVKDAFNGGYVQANERFANQEIGNVISYDVISQYLAVMLQFTFPSGNGVDVTLDAATNPNYIKDSLVNQYHFVIRAKFHNVKAKHDYPSVNIKKAKDRGDIEQDGGRITYAEHVTLTFDDIAYTQFHLDYSYDYFEVEEVRRFNKSFLPKELIEYILKLYKDKSELKGIKHKKDEYRMVKSKLNSIYGIMASDPIMKKFTFDNDDSIIHEVKQTRKVFLEELELHNNSRSRFLYFPWGSWVTSYARLLLNQFRYRLEANGISDYYCDTDSRFVDNDPKVQVIVNEINNEIDSRINSLCDYYDLDFENTRPANIEGERQPLGHWVIEGQYRSFKAMGPKRYATVDVYGNFEITVSGLDKELGRAYIESQGGMEVFDDELYIPKEHTGRVTALFDDSTVSGDVKDFNGDVYHFTSKGHVYMSYEDFGLSEFDRQVRSVKHRTGIDFGIWKEFLK